MTRVDRVELTPIAFLERAASLFPDRTAVVAGSRRLSYAELRGRARRLATALRAHGVTAGDRVAVVAPNGPTALEAHFGIPGAGAVLVAVNVRLAPSEIGAILADARPRLVILDSELATLASVVPERTSSLTSAESPEPDDPYEQLLATGDASVPLPGPDDEDAPIALSYTSGTTGQPKGAVYTHRGAYLNALGNVVDTGLTYDTSYLWTLPMFHCNGWCYPWAVTAVGGRHVCLRRPDPGDIWRLLEVEGVTHYCCAPTVQIAVVAHPDAHRLERPVKVSMGGAPPSPSLIAEMQTLGFEPHHLYGLTETYGPHTACVWNSAWNAEPFAEQARLRARQGQTIAAPERLAVLGPDDRPVPADGETIGEIAMQGNTVMAGYFERPDATAEAFRGGWFRSGDLAVVHPDGYVEIRDRAKDIVISGGENVSTIEVEQALAAHEAVLECAVVAVPDERWGERPKAFVTLREGRQASETELIAFCRERLAHFKCPDRIEFGELPKTSTGKVQKYVLREREWAGHEKRIN